MEFSTIMDSTIMEFDCIYLQDFESLSNLFISAQFMKYFTEPWDRNISIHALSNKSIAWFLILFIISFLPWPDPQSPHRILSTHWKYLFFSAQSVEYFKASFSRDQQKWQQYYVMLGNTQWVSKGPFNQSTTIVCEGSCNLKAG